MSTRHHPLLLLLLIGLFLLGTAVTSYSIEPDDASLYRTAIDAYRDQKYVAAAETMQRIIAEFPYTPVRDLAMFWLAQAQFRAGYRAVAAQQMAAFCREYPDNPLREIADDELILLAAAHERGEMLPSPAEFSVAARESIEGEIGKAERAAAERAHAAAVESSMIAEAGREETDAERQARKEAAAARIARIREALKKKAEERSPYPEGR